MHVLQTIAAAFERGAESLEGAFWGSGKRPAPLRGERNSTTGLRLLFGSEQSGMAM